MNLNGRCARVAGLLLGLVGLLVAPIARAQWVEAPGTGWAQIQVAHQQTQDGFNEDGNVEPLALAQDGQSIITTVRFTGALGLVRGVDAWVDVPFHRQEFNASRTSDLLTTGFGDPRVYLRIGPSLVGGQGLPLALALRGGAKFTSGTFNVDAETISLSEGQRDWEVLLEVGKSLHPWPVYVMGWAGYRWRERNEEINRDPGNERLFYVAAGGSLDRFQWKVAVDGLLGRPSTVRAAGIAFETASRELVQLLPTVGWRVGPGVLQATARFPVHGQSTQANKLPAAPTFTLGYFLSWDRSLW